MVSFSSYLLPLAVVCCHLVAALPQAVQTLPNTKVGNPPSVFDQTDKYPMPNKGNMPAHDPNVLEHNNAFYLFKGGVHVPIFKANDMSGPWKKVGTVLDKDSIIPDRENATRPWAPTTVAWKGKFYCFYSLSQTGSRKSAIGVASTENMEKGWKDHGALILTGNNGEGSPYSLTNAIDASFIVDQKTKTPYLNYGSYWNNIWQVELEDDLLSVKGDTKVTPEGKGEGEDKNGDKGNKQPQKSDDNNDKNGGKPKLVQNPEATQLTFLPNQKSKPEEGSWISFKDGYYYLWFSHGKCCEFEKGFPKKGDEYHIRVGRSKNVKGPYHDKEGHDLRKGGGTTVYASNHGLTYAPGGLGVLPGNENRQDILYYHYLDTTIGFKHKEAQLGWNYLEYHKGWPVAGDKKPGKENKDKEPK